MTRKELIAALLAVGTDESQITISDGYQFLFYTPGDYRLQQDEDGTIDLSPAGYLIGDVDYDKV